MSGETIIWEGETANGVKARICERWGDMRWIEVFCDDKWELVGDAVLATEVLWNAFEDLLYRGRGTLNE